MAIYQRKDMIARLDRKAKADLLRGAAGEADATLMRLVAYWEHKS